MLWPTLQAAIALGGSAAIAELDAAVTDREQFSADQQNVLHGDGEEHRRSTVLQALDETSPHEPAECSGRAEQAGQHEQRRTEQAPGRVDADHVGDPAGQARATVDVGRLRRRPLAPCAADGGSVAAGRVGRRGGDRDVVRTGGVEQDPEGAGSGFQLGARALVDDATAIEEPRLVRSR